MILQAGYQLQRDITQVMFSPFSPGGDVPRLTTKMALDMAQCAAGTAAALLPDGDNQVAWLELRNKLEAFNLFAHVDLDLDLCRDDSLASLVEHASRLGPYRSVWAIEGVGHFYAGLSRTRGIDLKNQASVLPPSSLVPLHSGAGLALADHCLDTIATAQVRAALQEFFALCHENSDESYAGAAYEALGLTTRNLHPHLVAVIDRQLAEIDETLVAYFWHGEGRAIYFAPTNFLPDASTSQRYLQQVRAESPHELARLNLMSGMIWALVLVNVRHPKVLEAFIRANARALDPDVFESALCSAALIWCDASPDGESLPALCSHRPSSGELAAIWETHVSRPCLEVLQHYAELREMGLGRLFRHRPLSELIG